MKRPLIALFAVSLIVYPGCLGTPPACYSEGTADWVQPGVYNEAVAKNLKDNPYSREIGFENANINNMTVMATMWPDDHVYVFARLNGPTQRFPLNQLEGVARELFQRHNLTFNPPPNLKPEYDTSRCGA